MATPVVMPQMGESIAEGTIVRWIKKVGDSVDRDEPLFEISTDKVDAEIPSPAAGTLIDIAVKEGETVPVNSVVATIGAAGEKGVAAEKPHRPTESRRHQLPADEAPKPTTAAESASAVGEDRAALVTGRCRSAGSEATSAPARRQTVTAPTDRQKSSPLVRRIAKEHNVDLGQIEGYRA